MVKFNMKVTEFFNKDVREFSVYNNKRAIPSIVDGFKPVQRKIIFGFLKKGNTNEEQKVSNASGFISAISDYHHGPVSLEGAIIGMAQNFTGSNNINLLNPIGQFGSRLNPENASSRYIFTNLNNRFRMLFKKEDDILLENLFNDDIEIEPRYYFPILPMVLINGTTGMGTGYSTNIFMYNPNELKDEIVKFLEKGKLKSNWTPWYKGYTGKVEKGEELNQFLFYGNLEIKNKNTIIINELPIGYYVDKYKKVLNDLIEKDFIKSYEDNSTEEGFEFIINCYRETTDLSQEELYKKFKLISKDTQNLVLWTETGKIKVFTSISEIIEHFVSFRLVKYEERRVKQIVLLEQDLFYNKEKIRFIQFYLANSMQLSKKKKDVWEKELIDNKFKVEHIESFLGIKLYNLSSDSIDKLLNEIKEIEKEIKYLSNITNKELYIKELKELVL